jgi:hypothetical protein
MDISYKLKDVLKCCDFDLKFSEEIGYEEYLNDIKCGTYIATCIVCGKKYEINLEVKG